MSLTRQADPTVFRVIVHLSDAVGLAYGLCEISYWPLHHHELMKTECIVSQSWMR